MLTTNCLMKNTYILLTILSLISFNIYSQVAYENGYTINNNDQKTACLIKNNDWKNNPSEIEIKYTDNEQPKIETISSIKAFGIEGKIKYERHSVQIDRSIDLVSSLDHDRNPTFKEEQLFLKVLIEGKASLYLYEDKNIEKFFFNVDNGDIAQLVYKSYLTNDNLIGKNNYYRQQISSNLKCEDLSTNDIQKLGYTENQLINIFMKYNTCANAPVIRYSIKDKKSAFNLNLKAGIKNSSLEIKNSVSDLKDTDFGNQIGFRLGLEAEFVLPFNNHKWSVIIEPTYQNFNVKKETDDLMAEVNYKSIEVPLGIRYYMFINEQSKLFINGMLIMDFDLNSEFKFNRSWDSFTEIKSSPNLGFGLGYNHDTKYSVELRYHSSRDLLSNFATWDSKYNSLALIFGYTVF